MGYSVPRKIECILSLLGTLYPIEHSRSLSNPYLEHSRFLSINNRMQVNNMQRYNTLNQLINGVPSDDPFL